MLLKAAAVTALLAGTASAQPGLTEPLGSSPRRQPRGEKPNPLATTSTGAVVFA